MKHSKRFLTILLAALFSLSWAAAGLPQSKPTGAKALFFDPGGQESQDPPPPPPKGSRQQQPAPKNVGIRYWIELVGTGMVTANRTFRTGDRIKLHAESNVDGYLTLWTKDAYGQFHQLFPEQGSTPTSNFLRANSAYTTHGHIVFKPPIADEDLLIHFSRKPGARPNPQDTLQDARRAASPDSSGAKALVFETDEAPQELGTYVVNQTGGPVMVEVHLRHRAR